MDQDKKTIYHIFFANVPFHVVGMLRSFIGSFGESSFFIIAGATKETKHLYEDLFSSLKYDKFVIIMENGKINEYSSFQRFLFNKKISHPYDFDLVKYMLGLSSTDAFLIHGLSSRWLNVLFRMYGFKNINWVCWGCWYYNKATTLRAFLTNWLDSLNYKIYKNIICLMPQDIDGIKKQLGNKACFFYIPYLGDNKRWIEHALNNPSDKQSHTRVLLGNSGYSIKQYDSFLRSLQRIGGGCKFTCMLSYGATENQIEAFRNSYASFINLGEISLLTEMLSKQDYVVMLNSFDVYVSPLNSQTGLAAIYLSLALGKKIYLQGNNYEYIKGLGAKVFHTSEFEADMNRGEYYLSDEEKILNKDVVLDLLDDAALVSKWDVFFNLIT